MEQTPKKHCRKGIRLGGIMTRWMRFFKGSRLSVPKGQVHSFFFHVSVPYVLKSKNSNFGRRTYVLTPKCYFPKHTFQNMHLFISEDIR